MIESPAVAGPVAAELEALPDRSALGSLLAYCRRNPHLVTGLAIILFLLLIGLAGPLFVDVRRAQPTSELPTMPPSVENPLGTDDQGRDLLAVLVRGVPLTLRIGFLAGSVGLAIGVALGLLAGYRGGWIDALIRVCVDMLLTIPGLLVLITISASIRTYISVDVMALVIASLAWRHPARVVRSQVLTLRERAYVQVARLSGMNTFDIIVREIVPNLLPFLAASFVGAVAFAILASVGLEALGLGPQNDPTLGMTIYWAIHFNALLRGLWWWWGPPILVIATLFIGLLLVSTGLDEIANPRLRRQA